PDARLGSAARACAPALPPAAFITAGGSSMSQHPLDNLADALIDEFSGTVGATLIRLVQCDDPEQVEFGVRPLDGHPADELAGFRAPESWVAIGVITGGWAAPMGAVRPSAHPDAMRVTQLVIVD